jgi:hypothetical protein
MTATIRRAAVAVGFALVMATGVAAPAGAATQPAAPERAAASCEVYAEGVAKDAGTSVYGWGYRTAECGYGPSHLTVQRYRGLGTWESMSTVTITGAGPPSTFVQFNCGGYGTQTYRTRHSGTTYGGYKVDYSSEIRVSC